MEFKPYTIIMSYYKEMECLLYNLNRYLNFKHPPEQIIIYDDGSGDIIPFIDKRIRLVVFEHNGCLAYMINTVYQLIKTDYFIFTSSTQIIPEEYIEIQFDKYERKQRITGMEVIISSLNDIPEVIFSPPYIQSMNDKDIIIDYCPQSPYLEHRDDFIWFNEAFAKYGYEDVDNYYRWICMQKLCCRYTALVFYKYRPKNKKKDGEFYSNQENNKKLLDKLSSEYCMKKMIPLFDKDNRYYIPKEEYKLPEKVIKMI